MRFLGSERKECKIAELKVRRVIYKLQTSPDVLHLYIFANRSDIVGLPINGLPLANHRLERHVHSLVLGGEVAHLLHVDLLEQCAHIDALDQLHDDLLQPLVVGFHLLILLDHSSVARSELLALLLEPLLLRLELREAELLLDDIIFIGEAASAHLPGILLSQLKSLLSCDLEVEHVLTLDLLIAQLLEHHISRVPLILKLMVQLHLHLSLGLKVFSFLVGFSYATTLNLVLKL